MRKIRDKIIGLIGPISLIGPIRPISLIGLIGLIGLIVVSCSEDNLASLGTGNGETSIAFQVGTATTTRAAVGLETLVKDIRIYGTKGTVEAAKPDPADTRVFDNYVLWYDKADKGLTATNTNEWEYVGSYVGSASDGTMSDMSSSENQTAINAQRTKYWDHGTSHYYFWAIAKASQGKFSADSYGRIASFSKAINQSELDDEANVLYYTAPIYVPRDGTTAEDNKGSYGKVVNLVFNRLTSKVRLGFYSDVTGWKVNSIHFYSDESTVATDNTIYLYGNIITAATATITYGYTDPKSPTATYSAASATTQSNFSGFGTPLADILSTESSSPTYNSNGYVMMLPTGTRTDALTLKCDYTLKSNDSDETITVTGASVTIPAADCSWQPNCAYTYIFKLTKGTLKPITLDALYTISESQGTTTTIEDATKPTITTYQDGSVTDTGITYKAGSTPIDITVMYDGTNKTQATDLSSTTLTVTHKATADGTESDVTVTYTDAKKATISNPAAGIYTVTYKYTDSGNDATVQKEITVVSK